MVDEEVQAIIDTKAKKAWVGVNPAQYAPIVAAVGISALGFQHVGVGAEHVGNAPLHHHRFDSEKIQQLDVRMMGDHMSMCHECFRSGRTEHVHGKHRQIGRGVAAAQGVTRTAERRTRDSAHDVADEGPAAFWRKRKKNIAAILAQTPNLLHDRGLIFAIDVGLDKEKLQGFLRKGHA